ncbi:MAG: hypothetical protein IIY94_00595 [Oscillospiraceae bacterium]|nr:hypothetical protein [Oscillospiraceae bacterium]
MICPNCGGETTGKYCPYCGTDFAAAKVEPQTDPQNTRDRVQAKQQDEQQKHGYVSADRIDAVLGDLPLIQFLRQSLKSKLMLLCTILVTLYAGCIGVVYGIVGFDMSKALTANQFDSYFSNDKIGRSIYLFSCVIHICLALWLAVSMWSIFCSAASRKKTSQSSDWFNSFRSFAQVGQRVFLLLSACAAVTAGLMLLEADFSKTIFYSIEMLTSSGAAQIGLSHVLSMLFEENIYRVICIVAVYLFATVRFTLLKATGTLASGMLRSGEATRWKIPPVSLLVFLGGVLHLGVGIVTLLQVPINQAILLNYLPLCLLGAALICCSVLLHQICAGVKQRQV